MTLFALFSARFDVRRSDTDNYSIATVTKVDSSAPVRRIMFHLAKTSSDQDEWIEFGSPRIAPLYSQVLKKVRKKNIFKDSKKVTKNTLKDVHAALDVKCVVSAGAQTQPVTIIDSKSLALMNPRVDYRPVKGHLRVSDTCPADPTDQRSFQVGGKLA